jgi:hypothetical protein
VIVGNRADATTEQLADAVKAVDALLHLGTLDVLASGKMTCPNCGLVFLQDAPATPAAEPKPYTVLQ